MDPNGSSGESLHNRGEAASAPVSPSRCSILHQGDVFYKKQQEREALKSAIIDD